MSMSVLRAILCAKFVIRSRSNILIVSKSPTFLPYWVCRYTGYSFYGMFLFNGSVPRCCFYSRFKSINQARPVCSPMAIGLEIRGIATYPESYEILVELMNPLSDNGFKITSRCPAVIYPSPRIMIGVIDMIVIMIIEVKTSKHIVDMDRQLSSELLFILIAQSLLFIF